MSEELVGVIGGAGLGDVLEQRFTNTETVEIETPFGKPSGPIVVGQMGAAKIAFLNRHGPGHKLSPSDVPYAANIFALKKIGVTAIIASGAVGSLREEISPKDLVIVDQMIDKTFRRRSSFFTGIAAVHCEMGAAGLRADAEKLLNVSKDLDFKTHDMGTYVCMEGPQFSTRAESLMHIAWGGDLIGMTAMPEAKLAREAQICYTMVAIASDYDCWRPHEAGKDKQTLLKEIIGNLQHGTENAISLIEAALAKPDGICSDDCHCRKSLELAMWTANDRISDQDKRRLSVLYD